jgi:hypothetical protein
MPYYNQIQDRIINAMSKVRHKNYINAVSEIVSGTSDDYFYNVEKKWSFMVQTCKSATTCQPARKEALDIMYEGVVGARELLQAAFMWNVEGKGAAPVPAAPENKL